MKPNLKRILSGMLSIAVAISAVPSVSTYADEVTVAYPYTLFASSGDEGAITVNADNFCVNGNVATNGSIISSVNTNINGERIENADESMIYIFDKIHNQYFSSSNVDKHDDDYTLEETNININIPTEVQGETSLTGNININSALKALENINLYGEVKNTNNSVIFSKYGDIVIDSQNVNLNGLVYAPFGTVKINAINLNLNNVVIIAERIEITCPNVNANYSSNASTFVGTISEEFDIPYNEWQYMKDDNENDFPDFFEDVNNWYLLKDTDGDNLPDCIEILISTDITLSDTDGDYLNDYYEVFVTNTDPTIFDTDDNGTSDGEEDFDKDGLNNYYEYIHNTSPWNSDSDGDSLTDGDEIHIYNTNPLEPDTDFDGLSDADENVLGIDPNFADTDNDGIPDGEEKFYQTFSYDVENKDCAVEQVIVSMNGTGNLQNIMNVESVMDTDYICSGVVGMIGEPFSIETTSKFDIATLSFKVNQEKLGGTDFNDLLFLWYDEDNYKFEEIETIYDEANSIVSIQTEHFSRYMIVDKNKWFEAWTTEFNYNPGKNETHGEPNVGYNTVLAIDCSGSMKTNDEILTNTNINSSYDALYPNTCQRIEAATEFINSMKGTDKSAVVLFTGSAVTVQSMTDDIESLKLSLQKISNGGGTSFHAALTEAYNVFDENSLDAYNANNRIILLSDGEDGNYDETLSLLNSIYAKESNDKRKTIKIYTVGLGKSYDSRLENIANVSKGESFNAFTANELVDIYTQFGISRDFDTTDIDGDGLYDAVETAGIRIQNGSIIHTDSLAFDSDNDGLSDGMEINPKIRWRTNSLGKKEYYFFMNSNPCDNDSDNDGLLDGENVNKWGWHIKDPQPMVYNNFIPFGTDEYFESLNNLVDDYKNHLSSSDLYNNEPINPPLTKQVYTDTMMSQVDEAEFYNLIPFEYWDRFCVFFNSNVVAVNTKELHYFRNKLNRAPATLDEMLQESENWELLSAGKSQYHMYDTSACYDSVNNVYKGEYNLKFVSKDGKYEAVYNFNGDLLNENNDAVNMGTYNYASPNDAMNHLLLDVKPYSNESYLYFTFPLYGGGNGWFNVPGGYVDCSLRNQNLSKFNHNTDAKNYRKRIEEKLK